MPHRNDSSWISATIRVIAISLCIILLVALFWTLQDSPTKADREQSFMMSCRSTLVSAFTSGRVVSIDEMLDACKNNFDSPSSRVHLVVSRKRPSGAFALLKHDGLSHTVIIVRLTNGFAYVVDASGSIDSHRSAGWIAEIEKSGADAWLAYK